MIITFDEKILRTPCTDVLPEEVDKLIKILENEIIEANKLGKQAIGLAAPQIGIFKKIAIIRLNDTKLNLVNCKIEKSYDLITFKNEACLSFPGKSEDTLRYNEVYVTNNLVEPNSFIATDFLAIAVQHELDHLNSTLFLDRLASKQLPVKVKKNKPNDLCSCGKNLKYKKCCGKNV